MRYTFSRPSDLYNPVPPSTDSDTRPFTVAVPAACVIRDRILQEGTFHPVGADDTDRFSPL